MRFLLLNQTFHPDVASTAQHLTDLALMLVERGHEVTVITSRRAYDDPAKIFPKQETWRGIRISRISSTGLGKSAKWRRAVDFGTFILSCIWRLLFLPRHDAVVALTSPPLISFLGAWISKLRGSRFFYWVMDFNPDEAIAAGWLRQESLLAKLLERMSRFSLRQARTIIALDRFMRDRIVAKGIPPGNVLVLPPWSHDNEVKFDARGRDAFRKAHGLDDKFVVMYSGNHSPCHPLSTLLAAADQLRSDPDILFCFIGGGSEFHKIRERVRAVPSSDSSSPPGSSNILCLPYQPITALSPSLSAADLHVVVMGNPFVGLVHPCKIYNILAVGAPVLYIGPETSHLSEIASAARGELPFFLVRHGNVEQAVIAIQQCRRVALESSRPAAPAIRSSFSKHTLLPKLISELESA